MKFGLFLALLVLLASTNVFGQQDTRTTKERKNRRNRINDDIEGEQTNRLNSAETITDETKPVSLVQGDAKTDAVGTDDTKPVTIVEDVSKSTTVAPDERFDRKPEEHKNVKPIDEDGSDVVFEPEDDEIDEKSRPNVCIKSRSFLYTYSFILDESIIGKECSC
jgi:hypothetical protein